MKFKENPVQADPEKPPPQMTGPFAEWRLEVPIPEDPPSPTSQHH